MSRFSTRHLWLLYTLLAVALTWPLAAHFTTHVPGDGIDDPSLAWNLWWIKSRLVDQRNFDIFHVAWMFHPIQINLAFYTLTPLNGLLSIPVQTGLSLIVANNLLALSSFVIGAFGAYLLARQEVATVYRQSRGTQHAALIAGIIYAFASSKFFYLSLGQFNIASSQWVPFCALYALRLARSTTRRAAMRNAGLAALFLTLQAWAELTYASFLLLFIALLFLWSLGRHRAVVGRVVAFVLLGLLFLGGIAPFLWAMIPDMRAEGDFFTSGGGFADTYSADLLGYLLPMQRHPWLGDWVDQFPFPHDKGQQIYLGYSALASALVGALAWWRQRAVRRWASFWIGATLFFWWMTLGAQVRWNGQPLPIPGPFALISQLPFFSGNRYPSRYSVMLMLCVAILAAVGLAYLLSRRSLSRNISLSRSLLVLVSGLFFVEHLAVPMPLSDFRIPALYERLAAMPGDFTLLELPTGWRNGARVMGKSDILIMMQQWYQTAHGKRRLGGNTSRNPLYKFQYFTDAPLIGDLIALMNATPSADLNQNELPRQVEATFDELVARNRGIAPTVLDFLGVQYVTVHVEKTPPLLQRFVAEVLPVTLLEQWQGTDWSGAPATIDLYAVTPQPVQPQWSIELATTTSTLYLAEGWATLPWQGVRYATRPCATLLLDLPTHAGRLTLQLAEPATPTSISLNDRPLPFGPTRAPSTVTVDFVADQAAALVDRLTLCAETATPLTALANPPNAAGWPIGGTGAAVAADLFVRSAGSDVGNFAQILRNGAPVMPTARGYNLAAFDPAGALLMTATFDTHLTAAAGEALAAWVAALPADTIVAGAVMDEASNALDDGAVQALATLGVAADLRGRFRWSHAFMGVKGAPAGSAVEQLSLLQPATVTVGVAVDAPTVYLGIRKLDYQMTD